MSESSERKEKFTPGPWSVDDYGRPLASWKEIRDSDGNRVADVLDGGTGRSALIAAAPDMYAALEKAIADYGKPGGPWNVPSEPGTWIEMAQSALAKARGES